MDLGATIRSATGTLSQISRQTDVVARNVAQADRPAHVRRDAITVSTGAGVRIEIERAAIDRSLVAANHDAITDAAGALLALDAVRDLRAKLIGPDGSRSLAARMGDLEDALRVWSIDPSGPGLDTIRAAEALARDVNAAASTLEEARRAADRRIDEGVTELRGLLASFERENDAVREAVRLGRTDHDAADRRDEVLRKIAEWLPVSTFERAHDDLVIVTQRGTILFEQTAREISFTPSLSLGAGQAGAPVTVDGLPLRAGESGRFEALLTLRDETLPTLQRETDEIARGLVQAYREVAPGEPDVPGLFRLDGAAGLLGTTWLPGAAALLGVHPIAAGDPTVLRDGGLNGAAYNTNPNGHPGHADRLNALLGAHDASQPLGTGTATLRAFATQGVGDLDGLVAANAARAERTDALASAISTRVGNALGTNVDEEMTRLLALERSYEATARVIAVADEMLATLMAAVR